MYGSEVRSIEVTAGMLWALAQRHKDMEMARKEGYLEGLQEGREEARREGRKRVLLALMERGVELPHDILEELNGIRLK